MDCVLYKKKSVIWCKVTWSLLNEKFQVKWSTISIYAGKSFSLMVTKDMFSQCSCAASFSFFPSSVYAVYSPVGITAVVLVQLSQISNKIKGYLFFVVCFWNVNVILLLEHVCDHTLKTSVPEITGHGEEDQWKKHWKQKQDFLAVS